MARHRRPRRHPGSRARELRGWAGRADARLLRHVVAAGTPGSDRLWTGLSTAANRSVLWWGIAAVLAGAGGPQGRRAAMTGATAIGLASALVNGPLKLLYRRARPVPDGTHDSRALIATPGSFSFPSGHTASAFAFATATGLALPAVAAPLGALAAAVGYSRVRTGIHFPTDVLAGAVIGTATGAVAHWLLARRPDSPPEPATDEEPIPRRAVLVTSGDAGSADQIDRGRQAMLAEGVEILAEVPVAEATRVTDWIERVGPAVLVVAAGGDGTVGAAADAVVDTDAVLAVLPLGTSNDVARSLGVPPDPVAAARLLTEGKIARIDAGQVATEGQPVRHFVHAATIGLNVEFAKLATRPALRKRFGQLTYLVAARQSLSGYQPFEVTLRYSGQQLRLRLMHLSVINAPVFGGPLGLRITGSSVDDRALDVIAIEHTSMARLMLGAARLFAGHTGNLHGVHRLRLRELTVHADEPLELALDGEVCAHLPAGFTVAGDALRVVTPMEFEDVTD